MFLLRVGEVVQYEPLGDKGAVVRLAATICTLVAKVGGSFVMSDPVLLTTSAQVRQGQAL